MTHVVIVIAVLLLWWLRRSRRKLEAGLPVYPQYQGRIRHALALAQPYVLVMELGGFFDIGAAGFGDENQTKFIRNQLLHYARLRTDADDAAAAVHFAGLLDHVWYRADLRNLLAGDDPVAAMAFACARLALVTRLAMLMGWIGQDTGCRILLLNLQRAQECFESWESYGAAFLAGYRQWIGAMRADSFAGHFDDDARVLWFMQGSGAWNVHAWPGPAAFAPERVAAG